MSSMMQSIAIGIAIAIMAQTVSLTGYRWWMFIIAANVAFALAGRR